MEDRFETRSEGEGPTSTFAPVPDFSTIVVNRSGGMGKTTVVRVLMLVLNFAGIKPQLVSIDSVGAGAGASKSKLAMLEADVVDLRFAADPKEVKKDPTLSAGLLDPLIELWRQRDNVLVDGGANTSEMLFDFAENRRFSKVLPGRTVNLLVPTTMDAKALDEALKFAARRDECDSDPQGGGCYRRVEGRFRPR